MTKKGANKTTKIGLDQKTCAAVAYCWTHGNVRHAGDNFINKMEVHKYDTT